ncbi:pseudouridine synthase [Chitinophaga pendula]|uniref:pseudouridine synthase n=1 Tax=Chitinophaga TaxID=79328 RepID=UPI000BAF1CDD|nr:MULTISPECIES: pseudouridine synthase [Chitinophaga]ASZ09688.1 pseudouridine synthase [Chitinophaga sp. MD30]UCJ07372.1 pseudouridine synthase [Chitinophaga pendula]
MNHSAHRYFAIHKPYDMVSQFVSSVNVPLLGELDFDFPEGTHAIGRLDINSEGLLLLTTNKKVTQLLFQGNVPHDRTYLVMVKDIVSTESLEHLRNGVRIRIKGGSYYTTPPCKVMIAQAPHTLWPLPIPHRTDIPHTWLLITLTEGKFHQVRKMVAAVKHKCQRLIRISIEDLQLGDLPPGGVREMDEATFFQQLRITDY